MTPSNRANSDFVDMLWAESAYAWLLAKPKIWSIMVKSDLSHLSELCTGKKDIIVRLS